MIVQAFLISFFNQTGGLQIQHSSSLYICTCFKKRINTMREVLWVLGRRE